MSWALVFAMAGAVEAAPPPTPSWWVDPASCPLWTTPLSREIALACEATGRGCDVSTSDDKAARRLVLQCADPDHWTLEAHDAGGTGLWHIEVRGDDDERLRAAAMWVARSDVTMAPEAKVPAPPPTPPAPAAPIKLIPPPQGGWGGLALAIHGSYYPDATGGSPGLGMTLRVHDSGDVVSFLPRSFSTYASLTGEATSDGRADYDQSTFALRLGVGLIWHAPHTKDIIGFSLESGLGFARIRQGTSISAMKSTDHHPFWYALAGIVAEAPVQGDFRPFLALRIGTSWPKAPGLSLGMVEIGFRWRAW
ncbi:hypothetical protein LVJ94_47155 [Pendulispora rubella]|uniref:Uncharacterized protein n=1 Tax=Pendulispora rubella TaxID=2741070 RepID=A0ABZ2L4H5_9BACT